MKQNIYQPEDGDPARIKQLLDSGRKEDFDSAVELALRCVLSSLHAEEHFDPVIAEVRKQRWYRNLESIWEILKPQVRIRQWRQLMSHLVEIAYSSRPYCVRCGECCLHGSPSLHLDDAELVAKGILSLPHLYALRQGERARLNLESKLGLVEQEVIKIKEKQENGQCIFYREQSRECVIYEHRPLQCQLQACWDPEPLRRLWRKEKLTRRHLFEHDQTVLKLIQAHDERCNAEELDTAFSKISQFGDEAALDKILEMLRYDTTFRTTLTEKGGFRAEELDLYFGRPLQEVVRSYGLRVDRDEAGVFHLVSDD